MITILPLNHSSILELEQHFCVPVVGQLSEDFSNLLYNKRNVVHLGETTFYVGIRKVRDCLQNFVKTRGDRLGSQQKVFDRTESLMMLLLAVVTPADLVDEICALHRILSLSLVPQSQGRPQLQKPLYHRSSRMTPPLQMPSSNTSTVLRLNGKIPLF